MIQKSARKKRSMRSEDKSSVLFNDKEANGTKDKLVSNNLNGTGLVM